MINITVRLGEPLWRKVNTKKIALELPVGATVADMLCLLDEQYPALRGFLSQTDLPPTMFLADELATPDTPLTDGAELMLLWAIAGG